MAGNDAGQHPHLPAIQTLLRTVEPTELRESVLLNVINDDQRTEEQLKALLDRLLAQGNRLQMKVLLDQMLAEGTPQQRRALLHQLLDEQCGTSVLAQRSNRLAILEETIQPQELLRRSVRAIFNDPPQQQEPRRLVQETILNNMGPGARDDQIDQLIAVLHSLRTPDAVVAVGIPQEMQH